MSQLKTTIFSGEYLTVMSRGDLMVYTDSDTVPGAGFLKLTKNLLTNTKSYRIAYIFNCKPEMIAMRIRSGIS